jgi:hypothetical protein
MISFEQRTLFAEGVLNPGKTSGSEVERGGFAG